MTILDLHEQFLPTTSAEKFSDPFTREILAQIIKDEGTKKIFANTTVDKVNSKVHVKYLYDEKKLPKLGENYFGATKSISVLHNKIVFKPEVASCMEQYLSKQEENYNYIDVNLDEACRANFQLHFVGYNFVVSATSSSTKVRMTTD